MASTAYERTDAATPVASATPAMHTPRLSVTSASPQPAAAPTVTKMISTAPSAHDHEVQAAPLLVMTPAAKRRRFVESSPMGSASVKYTPLDTVLADNRSINVDARVSFIALTKQTQSGQPCRRMELTEGATTKSLTVIGEQNVAALAAVDFHNRLQLRGVRCNSYRDQTTLVVYANDQLRASVSVVPDNDTD
eukprot:6473924-Amphidinium_carterae.1